MKQLTDLTPKSRRRITITAIATIALLAVGIIVTPQLLSIEAPAIKQPAANSPTTPYVEPMVAAPVFVPQENLYELPLATYNAVIPELLDSSDVEPENQWKVAVTKTPLTALYSEPDADAKPIASVLSLTVEDTTALAVYGVDGDNWILVSTPSRNVLPSENGGEAPSATFAWASTADFEVVDIEQAVTVDNASSTISIVGKDGSVAHTETVVLGGEGVPTPSNTFSYVEATYTDDSQPWTGGFPIILTGAHSSTLDTFSGDAALTGLHYSTSTGHSKGCVRMSAEMAQIIDALPIGTPVAFV